MREIRQIAGGGGEGDRVVPPRGASASTIAFVAAVLAFLAVLTIASALAAGRLAAEWRAELARNATVQIVADDATMEDQARAALDVLRTTPGVRSVRVIDADEQRAFLDPWLGADLPLDTLPLPLMIEVEAERGGLDAETLRLRLAAEAPAAIFDDHAAWRAPLIATATRLQIFAAAAVALIGAALGAVLTLAANAALAANGQVIRTLRLVGAPDLFITRAFVRRLTWRCLLGAALGTLAAYGLIAALPPAETEGFFLVGIGLAGWHWIVPALVPPVAAAIGFWASRAATLRHLRRLS